eukprot:1159973-Pelagomonas_calceolata.AAC.18
MPAFSIETQANAFCKLGRAHKRSGTSFTCRSSARPWQVGELGVAVGHVRVLGGQGRKDVPQCTQRLVDGTRFLLAGVLCLATVQALTAFITIRTMQRVFHCAWFKWQGKRTLRAQVLCSAAVRRSQYPSLWLIAQYSGREKRKQMKERGPPA